MSPKDAVSGAHFPGKVLELTNSRVQGRPLELCTSAPGSVGAGAMMVPRWWHDGAMMVVRWLGRWWDEQTVSASETVAGGIWLTLPPSCHTDTRLCALWPFMPHHTIPYHTIPYHAIYAPCTRLTAIISRTHKFSPAGDANPLKTNSRRTLLSFYPINQRVTNVRIIFSQGVKVLISGLRNKRGANFII